MLGGLIMNTHYSIEEKIRYLCSVSGISYTDAQKIAEAIDSLTFIDLKDLARAIQIFAKGR